MLDEEKEKKRAEKEAKKRKKQELVQMMTQEIEAMTCSGGLSMPTNISSGRGKLLLMKQVSGLDVTIAHNGTTGVAQTLISLD